MAPNCAAKQETRPAQALFPKYTVSSTRGFPRQKCRIRWRRCLRALRQNLQRTFRKAQPIRFRKTTGAAHPMAERLIFCLIDFRFFNSPEQPWHRPRCSSQATESAASNSSSKNAWRTSAQSEQAPAVLMLDSGAGGGSMAMRSMSLSEDISWLA
jgi:hypothetical protein